MKNILAAFLLSAVCSLHGLYADPTTQPLLQPSNIKYLGAFSVPTGDTVGCTYPVGQLPSHCFMYGGNALGYNPAHNSLFFGGHDQNQQIGEIGIPSTISLSAIAPVLQNLTDVTEGKLVLMGDATNYTNNKFGGTLVYNNRLITTGFVWYLAGVQTLSHGVSGLDLSVLGNFKGLYLMNSAAPPRAVSGWMTTIPPEWQPLLGGPALTGHCCSPGPQDSSVGPAATVFNPDDVGVKNPIPGTTLIYYPFPDHPLADPVSGNIYYNLATGMGGLAFPTGSRSVLFFGRQGTGRYCYGQGTSNRALDGQCYVPGPTGCDVEYCYDPSEDGQKGTHAYPYRHQVWAYDANDLLAVKKGTKQYWEIRPAIWPLPEMDSTGWAAIRGAAYDPARGRVYITQGYGDNPRVDVYQITVPGFTPTPPPPSGSGTLTLNLPRFLAINGQINADYKGDTPASTFAWSFTPATNALGSRLEAVGNGAVPGALSPQPGAARAPSAAFTTSSPQANLSLYQLGLGPYQVSVQAFDSATNSLGTATASVTLVPADLSGVRVYPNPWRSDRHSVRQITFDQLTVNTTVKIFTVSGHWVKTLPTSSTSVTWDLTNDSGDRVASGLYMYLITTDQGQKKTGQVAVIK